jgi:hypothetical protein
MSTLTITTDSPLADGYVGSIYFLYLDANGPGATPPFSWNVIIAGLPPGLALDPSGYIYGTPTTVGSYTFTVEVFDLVLNNAQKEFTLTVQGPSSPTITTTSLPAGAIGSLYSQTLQATDGVIPYTNWAITAGTLPTGLSLNASTGEISGTPTTPGTYSFTVEVTDSAAQTDVQGLSILIPAVNPSITTTSVPNGIAGTAYAQSLSATGGTPGYTWSLDSGTLPPGIFLSTVSNNGVLSGTPTTPGTYSFVIRVTDSLTGTDTETYTITITSPTLPIITTSSLPNGLVSTAYSQTVSGAGGALPYLWSIDAGSLPAGLTLNTSTGVISGTPTTLGTSNFTIKLTDGNAQTTTKVFSVTISLIASPTITTTSLPSVILGTAYAEFVQGTGGTLPYVWSLTAGALPTGLSLNPSTGAITGTPTVAGTFGFTVQVTDFASQTDTQVLQIIVAPNAAFPLITTTSLTNGNVSIVYSTSLVVVGGTAAYTWSISSGALPPGVTLNPSNGFISGIPSVAGTYTFTVQVTDANSNSDSQVLNLVISATGAGSTCCFCVFAGEQVNFNHNAGSAGVLTATGGTIISNTKWQAPTIAGDYVVTLNVTGPIGTQLITNYVKVIEPLKLSNTSNSLNDLLPGQSFQLLTNYPESQVTWSTTYGDIPIVTSTGLIIIPTNPADNCFGGLEATILGVLTDTTGCGLTSSVEVSVTVNPVFPTENFCGPPITKWKRNSNRFKTIIKEFEGGCDETHIKSKKPRVTWEIRYSGLTRFFGNDCQPPNVVGCPPQLATANRLDDFYDLVFGQFKKFTLVDRDTGEVWYNVRFSSDMESDHSHRTNSNSRIFSLVWNPCCSNKNTFQGGQCSSHGIRNYRSSITTTTTTCR